MKIISLNIWGGAAFEPLMQFIKESAPTTDIFCFQEILDGPASARLVYHITNGRPPILQDIASALSDFTKYVAPAQEGFGGVSDISYGLATFVKNGIKVGIDRNKEPHERVNDRRKQDKRAQKPEVEIPASPFFESFSL